MMKDEKRGDKLFVTVGGIIERERNGKLEILLQKRWKNKGDSSYNGTLEIPSGHIKYNETVFDALKREIKEECGLEITKIKPSINIKTKGKYSHTSLCYVPFCVGNFLESTRINLVFLCEGKGNLSKTPSDGKEARWVSFSELKKIVNETPENIFTHNLAILKYYIIQKERI